MLLKEDSNNDSNYFRDDLNTCSLTIYLTFGKMKEYFVLVEFYIFLKFLNNHFDDGSFTFHFVLSFVTFVV